jgi:hypothetical protein
MLIEIKQKEDFSFQGPVGICLGQVPHIPSKLFVGRVSELDEMADVLHPGNELLEQRRLVLGGIGGIGKTQLAVAYAKAHAKIYGSTLWLDAASEASLNDSFQSIASYIFNVPNPGALESKEIVRRIHQWLSNPKNTGWLLIFDNYDNPSQFQIDKYFPLASHGDIIVTTRRPGLVAGSQVSVKPLKDIDDSLMILETRSKRKNIRSGSLKPGIKYNWDLLTTILRPICRVSRRATCRSSYCIGHRWGISSSEFFHFQALP